MNAPRTTQDLLRAAITAHARADLVTAERLYRQVAQAFDAPVEALHNLGHVLVQQDRPQEAVAVFQLALNRRPDAQTTHNMIAQAYRRLSRYDEAIAHHRRAIALKPDYAQAHHDLGRLFQALGRIEEARGELDAAALLSPQRGEYYRSLAEVTRFQEGDPRLDAMQALARKAEAMPTIDRIELHFALGKALGDVGRHEASFQQYLEGNGVLRPRIEYDERTSLAMFEQLAATFSREMMQAKAGLGDPSERPIFILGMPRSGSTLVEQIFAGHPLVSGGGEMTAFRDAAQEAMGRPDAARELDGETLRRLGARYLERTRPPFEGALRVTDKMPGNFLLAGAIHLALPNAKIIHTVRDPADTCFSCFTTLFLDGHQYTADLGELGRYYRAYETLMAHWREVLPPGVMLEVCYEEVVADLEGQARRIVEHCGLEWDPACLEFDQAKGAVWTASAAQVRRPVYADSIGRWKPYEPWLGPLLAALDLAGRLKKASKRIRKRDQI
jgi:tetratricopeptide (TPR) repeat protein